MRTIIICIVLSRFILIICFWSGGVDCMQFENRKKVTLATNPIKVNVLTSEALFGKDKVIYILHEGERYHLVKTRQNKLLLTKSVAA